MKVFHCDQCDQILFFENSQCVSCGASLAYVPGDGLITALPANAANPWASANPALAGRTFRLCRNYLDHQTCNWAIPSDDDHPYCRSCRLTRVIPDVADPLRRAAWHRLELAKRRLVFTLLALNLPIVGRDDDPASGLSFEFRADPAEPEAPRVFTGHADGVITVNIAEADDSERERRRSELGEPYRTLLGHMRHESGHYYWNRLVRDTKGLDEYRAVFGDERQDYGEALQQVLTRRALLQTGRAGMSARTRARIRGRTGPKHGRTTCTWSTRLKPRAATDSCCGRGARTNRRLAGSRPRCRRKSCPSFD